MSVLGKTNVPEFTLDRLARNYLVSICLAAALVLWR